MKSEVRREGSERGARSKMWGGGAGDWRRTAALSLQMSAYYYYFSVIFFGRFSIIIDFPDLPLFWMVGRFCETGGRKGEEVMRHTSGNRA